MPTLQQIRQHFLSFFAAKDHMILPSSSLIPNDDPTLLFTNAGMVPLKDFFLGRAKPQHPRLVSVQKCVRAGGKHNDLENVGYTPRHHTFFEMMGNFSFNDYFKEEAIYYAWELVHKEFAIPKEKLWITVHKNDPDSRKFWQKFVADERIIAIDNNDNFWSMGDSGPCGYCSEIFFDNGDHLEGGLPGTSNQDGPRYVEIWNIVFMEFEQFADGRRIPLKHKAVDTGMGLERITAVLNGQVDNYNIDLFEELIGASKHLITNSNSIGHRVIADPLRTMSFVLADGLGHRVISDHLRTMSFVLADGVTPFNEGRGYVLRRIMRRAIRHAHMMGCKEPVLYKLFQALKDTMGEQYPELIRNEQFIVENIKLEEEKFIKALEKGLEVLDKELKKNSKVLGADVAFKLYDTYGFPLDLTQDILKAHDIIVDEMGFNALMQQQKERSVWKGSGDKSAEDYWYDILNNAGTTEFLGYEQYSINDATVKALVKDNNLIEKVNAGDEFWLIVDKTSFYGESGGQVGDIGIIKSNNAQIKVLDTKKKIQKLIAHKCLIEKGSLFTGDSIELSIDVEYRKSVMRHHSATHILHHVLRQVLGNTVLQKGSLVASDKLRFDFAFVRPMSQEEIIKVENICNDLILHNSKTTTQQMSVEDALKQGAMALFGEKYEKNVRVLSMGDSVELCGGTHVSSTAEIGLIKIVSESGIASGIRRIEAVAGKSILNYIRDQDKRLQDIAKTLRSSPNDILSKIENLQSKIKTPTKTPQFVSETIGNYRSIIQRIEVEHLKEWKNWADICKKNFDFVLFYVIDAEKSSLLVASEKENINADSIVKELCEILQGKGGGRKDLAQGGGLSKYMDSALERVNNLLISLS